MLTVLEFDLISKQTQKPDSVKSYSIKEND